MKSKLTIVGIGNMGGAIARGLLGGQVISPSNLFLSSRSQEKLDEFKDKKVNLFSSNVQAIKDVDIIVLAIKPQIMENVLEELKDAINSKQLVISIAAGLEMKMYKKTLGEAQPVVRVMPNICATVNASMSAWVKSKEVDEGQVIELKEILKAIGNHVELNDENLLNQITAVSGSGPAYFFYLTEILAKAGEELGLEKSLSERLAKQTIIGSAELLKISHKSAGELKEDVTSKGGTTEAALTELEKNEMDKIFKRAVKRAYERSKELRG